MRAGRERSHPDLAGANLRVKPAADPVARRRGLDFDLDPPPRPVKTRGRNPADALHRLEEEIPLRPPRGGRLEMGPIARRTAVRMPAGGTAHPVGRRPADRDGPAPPDLARDAQHFHVHFFSRERAFDEPHTLSCPDEALTRRSELLDRHRRVERRGGVTGSRAGAGRGIPAGPGGAGREWSWRPSRRRAARAPAIAAPRRPRRSGVSPLRAGLRRARRRGVCRAGRANPRSDAASREEAARRASERTTGAIAGSSSGRAEASSASRPERSASGAFGSRSPVPRPVPRPTAVSDRRSQALSTASRQ